MRTQSVIFVALLSIVVLSSHTAAGSGFLSQKVKALIEAQSDCILNDQNCDMLGKTLKIQLPILLKGCTVEGCPAGRPQRVVDFIKLINTTAPHIWKQVVTKYAV